MPNNDHQDTGSYGARYQQEKELSNMLERAQVPRSPTHVDNTILRHAKVEAERVRAEAESRPVWLGVGWRSALATCSIAGIALLVVLDNVDGPVLRPEMVTEKTLERVRLEQTDSDLAVQTQRERQVGGDVAVVEAEASNTVPDNADDAAPASPTSVQVSAVSQASAASRAQAVQSSPSQLPIINEPVQDSIARGAATEPSSVSRNLDDVPVEEVVEEVLVTGSFIRNSSFSNTSSVEIFRRPLLDRLNDDDDALGQFITLMNAVLDDPIPTPFDIAELARDELQNNVEILIERYVYLRDSQGLSAAIERYDALILEQPMLALPDSLAESMGVLQMLQ